MKVIQQVMEFRGGQIGAALDDVDTPNGVHVEVMSEGDDRVKVSKGEVVALCKRNPDWLFRVVLNGDGSCYIYVLEG